MNDLVVLYSELKREMQGLKKTLVKLSETHANSRMQEWIRKDECMKMMGISLRTLNRLTHTGLLPYSKINGLVYIKTTDIDRLLNENYSQHM